MIPTEFGSISELALWIAGASYLVGEKEDHQLQIPAHSCSSFKPISFKPSTFRDSLMPATVRGYLSSAAICGDSIATVRSSPKPACREYGSLPAVSMVKPADGGSRPLGVLVVYEVKPCKPVGTRRGSTH